MNTYRLVSAAAFALAIQGQSHGQAGQLDPNFNATGYRVTDMSGTTVYDGAVTALLRSNGYTVVGDAVRSSIRQVAIARYANDGTLAQQAYSSSPIYENVGAALARGNGLMVVGYSLSTTDRKWLIRDYDEQLEPTAWGIGGALSFSFNDSDPSEECMASAIAAQPGFFNTTTQTAELRFVVAGYSGDRVAVARLRPSFTPGEGGFMDNSFSSDGKMLIDIPDMANERATGVAIASDGSIFVTGYGTTDGTFLGGAEHGFIAKLTSGGDLDLAWGTNGVVKLTFWQAGFPFGSPATVHSVRLHGITIDTDGNLLVHGGKKLDTDGNWDFLVARRQPDGTTDGSFGSSGSSTVAFSGTDDNADDMAKALVIQPDEYIVLAGSSRGSGTTGWTALARLNCHGAIDQTFGTSGRVETNVAAGLESAESILIAGQRIVVGGWAQVGTAAGRDFAVLRYLTGPDQTTCTVGILELSSAASEVLIFPNPVAEVTTFKYTLAQAARLSIVLHDMQGREVASFLQGRELPAGEHQQVVEIPAHLAAGNYLVVFSSPEGRTAVQVSK
ncbi:MAG: T9SS type A sorting domain-containing protein [Flavobacteriales bacterium]|nr:T9SS type A sorting domain-containing protein [Flavobacteriales bacterium]